MHAIHDFVRNEAGAGTTPEAVERAFRAIFEAAPYAMVLVDRAGRIVASNDQLAAMFGCDGHDLRGTSVDRLLPERLRETHERDRGHFARLPGSRAMGEGRDLVGLRRDGVEFPVEVGLGCVETSRGTMTCAAIVDLTRRHRAELRLREALIQLDEFTAVASHDLRAPLRHIAHLAGFLRQDHADELPAPAMARIAAIEEQVERMDRLIADLLAYARAGARGGKARRIDLADLVRGILSLEAPPPRMAVTLDLPDEPLEAMATPFETVLRNFVANAIQHHDRPDGRIVVRARHEAGHCRVEVEDDGPGIPEAQRERVFRLFHKLDGNRPGRSGLGLAVAQRLAARHGATIALCEPAGGRGTLVRLDWPRFARAEIHD